MICKLFVRPHLDYSDIIYNQHNNASISDKVKLVQYYLALAITRETGTEIRP